MLQSRPRHFVAACVAFAVTGLACHQLDFSPRVPEGEIDIYDHLFSVSVPSEDHVVAAGDWDGIAANVAQQFEIGRRIIAKGLVPIIEPEVDIHCPDKAAAEDILHAEIKKHLDGLGADEIVMLKLTLPEKDNLYADFIAHPNVARVVALSGGYSREEANERLARQHGMVASFSRALAEGLSAQQSDDEFNATLDASIASIAAASAT